MKEELLLEKSAKSLTKDNIADLQQKLHLELPDQFVEFYLKHNGGVPSRAYFFYNKNDEIIEISVFFSLLYKREGSSDDTIEDRYLSLTGRKILPLECFPFAKDWGGNLFCLNLLTQEVLFVLLDMGPISEKSFLPIALSFDTFINSLMTEEEAEEAGEDEEDS